MAPNSAGRGRVALMNPESIWLLTATGAFSPVCPLINTGLQLQYDAYQMHNDCSELVIKDIRAIPGLKDRKKDRKKTA